ncbi:MAG: hypothetical protein ACYS5V_16155, partial [Planctomycetota bacterium]
MTRRAKLTCVWLCAACVVPICLFFFGHRLERARTRRLRSVGRTVRRARVKFGMLSASELLDAVSAILARHDSGTEMVQTFEVLDEWR